MKAGCNVNFLGFVIGISKDNECLVGNPESEDGFKFARIDRFEERFVQSKIVFWGG